MNDYKILVLSVTVLVFLIFPEYRLGASDNNVQLGSRPLYLINDMAPSDLKRKLQNCQAGPFKKTDFSIGHRGAPLRFPEHTKESYIAAAQQGAGIMECDVTFTKDRELVCRHSQCDLHTTTNILTIPELAAKCSEPFTPADPVTGKPASALCCTSDITLAEYNSLCGRMDTTNSDGANVEEYLDNTPSFNTNSNSSCGTLLTHTESIELFKESDVKFMPELKTPSVEMPYLGDYSQEDFSQQLIDEYKMAEVSPSDVWVQSFNLDDLRYWIENEPEFGRQAVYLDSRPYTNDDFLPTLSDMQTLKSEGINIIAPPIFALVTLDANNNIVPSDYANFAKAAGLDNNHMDIGALWFAQRWRRFLSSIYCRCD